MTDKPRIISSPMQFMHLGFTDPAHVVAITTGGVKAVLAWNEKDGMLTGFGAVGKFITSLSSASPYGGLAAPPVPVDQVQLPPILQPTPQVQGTGIAAALPQLGQTPGEWLAAVSDVVSIKEWVFNEGIKSKEGAAWALFSNAMGWELPASVEETKEPEGSP